MIGHVEMSRKARKSMSPDVTLEIDEVDPELESLYLKLSSPSEHARSKRRSSSRPSHPIPKMARVESEDETFTEFLERQQSLQTSPFVPLGIITTAPEGIHKPTVFRPGHLRKQTSIGKNLVVDSESDTSESDDGFRSWNSSRAVTPLRSNTPALPEKKPEKVPEKLET
jgi:hypothetical protein